MEKINAERENNNSLGMFDTVFDMDNDCSMADREK